MSHSLLYRDHAAIAAWPSSMNCAHAIGRRLFSSTRVGVRKALENDNGMDEWQT
eukprot:COSAG02_NODE_6604_length_3466_cov_3.836650_5_plen_54_part_00